MWAGVTPRSHEAGATPRAQVGKEETGGSDGPLLPPQTRHGSWRPARSAV